MDGSLGCSMPLPCGSAMRGARMTQPAAALPERLRDVEHLEDVMTTPSPGLLAEFGELTGDLIILGVGGKIGPTLARLAKRAAPSRRVIGVARLRAAGCAGRVPAHAL